MWDPSSRLNFANASSRSRSAYGTGSVAPHTGPGQHASPSYRPRTCTCNCLHTHPMAATFTFVGFHPRCVAFAHSDISRMSCAWSSSSRSCISTIPSRRGTSTSHGHVLSSFRSTRHRGMSPTWSGERAVSRSRGRGERGTGRWRARASVRVHRRVVAVSRGVPRACRRRAGATSRIQPPYRSSRASFAVPRSAVTVARGECSRDESASPQRIWRGQRARDSEH